MLTASIAGNMMGSGIFLLPATLSKIGTISIFGWFLSLIGAAALALVFSKLSMLIPKAGGPYAFTRLAYGNYLAFQTAFVYWIGAWIGNIAVSIVLVGYLSYFFPALHNTLAACIAGLSIIWFFVFLNMFGPRFMGRIQLFTTSVMLIPIICTALLGWYWFDPTIFADSFQVSDKPPFTAITQSAAMTLWAFLGVETACVNAGVVKNPAKTVPIATLLGVLIAGVAYILSTSVIMGIIPAAELAQSASPFALLATKTIGSTGGAIVSVCAIIACAGTLSGWTLVVGQISRAVSLDKLFPHWFAKLNKFNTPYLGLLFASGLMSIVYLSTLAPTIGEHFTIMSETTVFMIVLPYLYSSVSLLIIDLKSGLLQQNRSHILYTCAACIGIVYSIWAIIGLGETIVFYGLIAILISVVFYVYPALKKEYPITKIID